MLRYEMSNKIQKQLNLKSRSSAQYAYKRYLNDNSFEAQKLKVDPQNFQKNQRKGQLPMFLKIPNPHWSALEWLITLPLATIQFSEVQLDEF